MTMTDYVCGNCGEEFATNCYPDDIACPECESRLCEHCGRWSGTASDPVSVAKALLAAFSGAVGSLSNEDAADVMNLASEVCGDWYGTRDPVAETRRGKQHEDGQVLAPGAPAEALPYLTPAGTLTPAILARAMDELEHPRIPLRQSETPLDPGMMISAGEVASPRRPEFMERFLCPRCGRISYSAHDVRESYCGACHDWTGLGGSRAGRERTDLDRWRNAPVYPVYRTEPYLWRCLDWGVRADGYRLVIEDGAMIGLACGEDPWPWGDPRWLTSHLIADHKLRSALCQPCHQCDDGCVCPRHQTPMIYWPRGDEHACQDVSCVYGHGIRALIGARLPRLIK